MCPTSRAPHRARPRRAVTAGLIITLAACAATTSAAASEPATMRLTGASPAYPTAVPVTMADGTVRSVRPSRYHYAFTTAAGSTLGVPAVADGFCADTAHYVVSGRDYPVELQTAADTPLLATPGFREAGWLVARSREAIATAADPQLEAAAYQVAVWQLTGQAAAGDSPTGDARINARVRELRAGARGRSLPDAIDVDAVPQPTCRGVASPVTVTGAPGAEVALTASDGALVEPARVTLDATGTAHASLSLDGAGVATVTARMQAPRVVRAAKPAGALHPQDQILVVPGALEDSDSHAFQDCGGGYLSLPGLPAPIGAAPGGDGGPAPASAVVQDEPAPAADPVLAAASPVSLPGRDAAYRVVVRNTTGRAARGVVVRQALPRGAVARDAWGPRGTRVRVGTAGVTWTVPRLAPGASVLLRSTVAVPGDAAGGLMRADVRVRGLGPRARARVATSVLEPVTAADQGF